MPDLKTTYLGLELKSPIVASPSPLTGDPAIAVKLEKAGAAALVLPSLFEEEILHEEAEINEAIEQTSDFFAESLDFFPDMQGLLSPTDRYLENVQSVKQAVSIPVIASLNAVSSGGWVRYAKMMQDAGADAIELNIYQVPTSSDKTGAEIETELLSLIRDVRSELSVPLAVKLSPYFASFANFAQRVVEAGANGLVLFNRFYQPDLDLDDLQVTPRLELSQPWEVRMPLRWVAILRGELEGKASLAATSGVHSGEDIAKLLLAGADVTMTTSALLQNGPDYIRVLEEQLVAWLQRKEYESVSQLRGSVSYRNSDNPSGFERANYLRTLRSWASQNQPLMTTYGS